MIGNTMGGRMNVQYDENELYVENNLIKSSFHDADVYPASERKEDPRVVSQVRPSTKYKNNNLVLSLVSTLLGAIQSEQCLERLLCELGWSLSEVEAARVVVQLAGVYVPPEHAHLLAALRDAVLRSASCSQYRCGKLPSRDEL
ncbi:uncharacterized protein LOC125043909 isoform X2 [Penaeus chinensis]|uniref:uncharacterized protein LOC125043909 isoform X2 n=1 Tax=Penaeus chinensis TaxID=139456 RepID=UPI001FB85DA7|nr:uncharacterized protein LOC125043909 isoform X2 [Penaeus chinensis]